MPNTALKPSRNNAGLVFGKGVWPGGLSPPFASAKKQIDIWKKGGMVTA
jgi:hypothetical protein